MKQIFDTKFQEGLKNYLKEAGVEKSYDIVNKIYKKEIKNEVTNKLKFIIECLEKDNYKELEKTLAFSSSGDGYGGDNYYIDFSDITDCTDIMSVIEILKRL